MATVTYQRKAGRQLVYEIRATRMGGYDVMLDGKVIRQSHVGDRYGVSRFGSKKLEAEALEYAKLVIEDMPTDEG
jgi:hypothetical protein